MAVVFFVTTVLTTGYAILMARGGVPVVARLEDRVTVGKHQGCQYSYEVDGMSFDISGTCDGEKTAVEYLPGHPDVARFANQSGGGWFMAGFSAFLFLGAVGCIWEELRNRAGVRSLGPKFRTETADPKFKRERWEKK